MPLKTIFEKPVNRSIEGVIKADDDASLRLEVEEYVLTNEVEKRLESFLDAYNNYDGANGVWISGFFGSGKSHLLKILALLMENREVEGAKVLDIILPKCEDNEILRGDLKRAVSLPSKSILFNIDQKADVISKTQIDALVAVFVKVFDESCGYYGKQAYIAQFERELDQDNLLGKFRDAFKKASSKDWDWGRMRAKRVATHIDKAYQLVTGQGVSDILDKYRSDYSLSIEDFAEQVHIYIEKQEKDFRLNFFVDEVGQYVADNVKLMTNLQTIAESLATKSRGRAWVIVTAQEDMNTVVGEMNKQQSNDFSKIQARFENRMKLTSADVAEVIQKRLLQKNETGIHKLSKVYDDQVNNFKTLFDFADGAQLYRNFQDRDHFIHTYPFIPYQFILFQTAIQNLSKHNVSEGKHRSVGERSMLGVFQQVAVQVSDHEVGQLASFDLMFEGIRSTLKAKIQRSIQLAEKHLDNKFAVKVLKALFLVKYIKEFRATQRNLTVLMLDEFNKNMEQLNSDLTCALNILEQQTYIQRNGEVFEFLTDEEKDVEEEIKNTDIEISAVNDHLYKIVFDSIIRLKKIRYDQNDQDYPFSRKMDDKLFGREYELSIHVISPFNEHADNEQVLTMQSAGRDELLVIMPPDERMMRDLLMYERTNKYIRQNISTTQQESIKRILADKTHQNHERYADLKQHIENILGKSKMFINTNLVDIKGTDPQGRIIKGFHDLIVRTYPNLKMLLGFTYTESYVSKCLKNGGGSLFGNNASMLSEAEQEMLSFVKGNKANGIRTTVKSLIQRFEKKSYGWYYAAVLCILAKLCAAGKVELNSDSNILEDDQLEKTLLNTHGHANLVIEPLNDFTARQIRSLKQFYEEFFDSPTSSTEAKALGKEIIAAIKEKIQVLSGLAAQRQNYPFLFGLDIIIKNLEELQTKAYTFFLTDLHKIKDNLLDLKEDVVDPIQRFMTGPLKTIYDDAANFLKRQEHNFSYIEGDESDQILTILKDSNSYKNNKMNRVKSLIETVSDKVDKKLKTTKQEASDRVNVLVDKMIGMDDFLKLSQKEQDELKKPFEALLEKIQDQNLVAMISDTLHRFEDEDYNQLLSQLSYLGRPKPEPSKPESYKPERSKPESYKSGQAEYETEIEDTDFGTGEIKEGSVQSKEKNNTFIRQVVGIKKIKVNYSKAWIENESEVEDYLSVLKKAIIKEINDGKRVQV
ncbi:MAG: BREX system P-loop protein BrxC [Desulfobacteraceae bacterium]|nr:BREX system P-loop protein BrxC [Desulfobacteraceae bacterium]